MQANQQGLSQGGQVPVVAQVLPGQHRERCDVLDSHGELTRGGPCQLVAVEQQVGEEGCRPQNALIGGQMVSLGWAGGQPSMSPVKHRPSAASPAL